MVPVQLVPLKEKRDYVGIAALITAVATGLCLIYTTFVSDKSDKQDRMIESVFELMDYRLKNLEAHDGLPSPSPHILMESAPKPKLFAPGLAMMGKPQQVIPKNFADLKKVVDKTAKAWKP
jgi:hypothetical protein